MHGRRRTGRQALGLLLAAAMVVAGCGGDDQRTTDAEGQGLVSNPRQPAQVLLRARAQSLGRGDLEGYLAGLEPEARAFEEPIAKRALALPIHKFDMAVDVATISDDGSRFTNAQVTLRYSYKGLPEDNPFRLHLVYEMERRQGKLVVTKSRLGDPLRDDVPPPPLWSLYPVEITESPHFLVMAVPGTAKVAEVAAQAEAGLARLLPQVTLATDDRYLFVAAKDTEVYEAIGGPGGSDAYTLVEFIETAGDQRRARPDGRHFAADLSTVGREAESRLPGTDDVTPASIVFQHELAHLALSRFTRPCTNLWVIEGAAVWLSGESRLDQWKEHVEKDDLDGLVLNPPTGGVDYSFALAAVLHLLEQDKPATFFDFYQNFKDLRVQTVGCSGETQEVRSIADDKLLRRYYRLTLEEVEDAARAYIKKAVENA